MLGTITFSIVIDFGTKTPSGFTGAVQEFYLLLLLRLRKEVCWIHPDQSDVRGREHFRRGKGVRDDNDMVNIKRGSLSNSQLNGP